MRRKEKSVMFSQTHSTKSVRVREAENLSLCSHNVFHEKAATTPITKSIKGVAEERDMVVLCVAFSHPLENF